MKHLQLTGAVR